MTEGRYHAHGSQAEFEPGSHGRVLSNKLGIVRVREMQQAESDALLAVHERLVHALARCHAELVLIHPFRGGNGRCAIAGLVDGFAGWVSGAGLFRHWPGEANAPISGPSTGPLPATTNPWKTASAG